MPVQEKSDSLPSLPCAGMQPQQGGMMMGQQPMGGGMMQQRMGGGQPQQQDSSALTMHPQAQLEAVETVAGPVEKGIRFSTWSRMTGR